MISTEQQSSLELACQRDAIPGKEMGEIKLVCSGAGAAALACLNMLKTLGVKQEDMVCDQHGVLRKGVKNRWISTNAIRQRNGSEDTQRSAGWSGCVPIVRTWGHRPGRYQEYGGSAVIFALANPTPEIMLEVKKKCVQTRLLRPDGRLPEPSQ